MNETRGTGDSRAAGVLLWIQRGLLTLGAVLSIWWAAVWLEARFFEKVPVPPPLSVGANPRVRLHRGTWLGKLEAPSVRLSATVLEGSDDATLSRGAGHIEDTAFPGESGNVGIAGHRDSTFRAVGRLRVGDALDLTTADRRFHYRVSRTSIVNPQDVYVLDPTAHSTLTLVTCYPFNFVGEAPKRFIVHAELVDQQKR